MKKSEKKIIDIQKKEQMTNNRALTWDSMSWMIIKEDQWLTTAGLYCFLLSK